MGAESLHANRQGVDTAGHNIANAQTEGYSRQRVNVTQRTPSETRGNIIGNGVYVKSIGRAHDKFVERQLNLATQDSSASEARQEALLAIEQIYSTEMQASIADELTGFFNSMQILSTNPDEAPTRTSVRESAQNLANAFKRVDFNLKRHQKDLDDQVLGTAQEINDYCKQIAELNISILTLESGRVGAANDLRDQQDKLIRDLSERINISYYIDEHGATCVRGPSQTLLVDGKIPASVEAVLDADSGRNQVTVFDSGGHSRRNITDNIEKGRLKSIIDVRDRLTPELIHSNNMLAVSVAENVNAIHRSGYGMGDFRETTGRNLFDLPQNLEHAAQDFNVSAVIMEDINALSAAATPNAPGDNVIANEMLRLRSKPIMHEGKMTFNEYYSDYVSMLGIEVQRTNNLVDADKVILGDLSKRREAISGVSLDEEAVDLLRWQTAFAASSKVITTTDEMLETVLSLKR